MNRRSFLTSAGLATAYSVFVRTDGLAEAHATPPAREEIFKAFQAGAPSYRLGSPANKTTATDSE